MIDCRFIYKFKGSGTSDSLNKVYKVQSVPRVGESLGFIGDDGNMSSSVVLEVAHYINTAEGTHEINVYYGEAES